VTRVENFCAIRHRGHPRRRSTRWRPARADIALALGVEKLKDAGYGGLPVTTVGTYIPTCGTRTRWPPPTSRNWPPPTAASMAWTRRLLKRAISRMCRSRATPTGPRTRRRIFQSNRSPIEQALKAPIIAEPLGLYDCAGVSDGAAAVPSSRRPDIARALGKTRPGDRVKSLQLAVSNGWEMHSNDWDGSYVHTARIAARRAYAEAGITRPREQISMTEVHDCFSITELVTMEDLGLSDDGGAVRDVLDGRYDADGVPSPARSTVG
jgi:acetyl-CoA C-acetyltransferase